MASSEIVIVEQTGLARTLRLRGAGLPLMGANWPGRQRLVTTWYPGNSAQASQQVLGPIDAPSGWSGVWNTTRLNRSPCQLEQGGSITPIVFADDLRLALDDILRKGSLLSVQWNIDNQNPDVGPRHIIRLGRSPDWDFSHDRIDDIHWKITWEWVGRGSSQNVIVLRSEGAASPATLQDLLSSLQGVQDAALHTKFQQSKRTIPNSASPFTLGQLEGLLNAPNDLMKQLSQDANLITNRLQKIGDLIQKGRALPFEVANHALDVANNAIAVSNNFLDHISRISPEQMQTQIKLSSLTKAASYYADGVKQAQVQNRAAQRMSVSFQPSTPTAAGGEGGRAQATPQRTFGTTGKGTTVAVYVVKGVQPFTVPPAVPGLQPSQVTGETLLAIALRFYGDAAGIFELCKANGLRLTTTYVQAGQILLIPPLTGLGGKMTATSGNLNNQPEP